MALRTRDETKRVENGEASFVAHRDSRVKRILLQGAGRIIGIYLGTDVAMRGDGFQPLFDVPTGVWARVQVEGAEEDTRVTFTVEERCMHCGGWGRE